MTTYETRNDMVRALPKNMVIAELGVFEGRFAEFILNNCAPRAMFMVDLFEGNFGSGDKDGKNYRIVNLLDAYDNLKKKYGQYANITIMRVSTNRFFSKMPSYSLDMVYIDADHSFDAVATDLENARLVVRPNGFICGHDYVQGTDVQKAVDHFCRKYNYEIDMITKDGCPSYCIINKI